MKILVVDDELVSRKKLQKILSNLGECEAVGGGKVAVAAFKKALKEGDPFDLVTLDIVMPEMDGTEALVELRELEIEIGVPEEGKAVIMMVTSHGDKDNIVTSISAGCDNYIIKPFDKKTIFDKLDNSRLKERLFTANRAVDRGPGLKPEPVKTTVDPVEAVITSFKTGGVSLPPLPQMSVKFNDMLKKGIDYQVLAGLLKQDISISAKLINVSNSAYYGSVSKTTTLDQAISRLGLVATKQYVDAICNRAFYAGSSKKYKGLFETLWEHSLCCAIGSQAVSKILKLKLQFDPFTAGLLHDIGKLILLQGISELERKGKFKGGIDPAELMKSVDVHHNNFGADVLKKWNFSNEYVQVVLYHNNLGAVDKPSGELLVVHFANLLAKTIVNAEPAQAEIKVEDADSARLLEITPDIIVEIEDRVNGQMEALKESFS
ncbi:MAG: HDOD domain-containing protein [Syntrophaceae bacterium]|nr:HDOD domain-containing protein [Syntrophaceae bacterium]